MKVHGQPYTRGDLVWLHSPARPRGSSKKLYRPWKGPFRVMQKLSDATYQIKNTKVPYQSKIVHFNQLKTYANDTRAISDNTETASDMPEQVNGHTPHPPVGSNLEVVDQDLDGQSEQHNEQNDANSQQERGPLTSSDNVPPRYPRRNTRRPSYYHDEI